MALLDPWMLRVYCYQPTNLQLGVNTFFFHTIAEVGTGASTVSVATGWDAILAPLYKAWLPATSRYYGVEAQYLIPPINVPVTTNANAGVGTAAGNNLPNQASGLISIRTQLAGPKYRGRAYIPFPAASNADVQGDLTPAAAVLLQAIATAVNTNTVFGGGGNTSTLALCVRHRTNKGVKPALFGYQEAVTATADQLFATQRRRGQFGRSNPLPF
jgi:hypothetical protein